MFANVIHFIIILANYIYAADSIACQVSRTDRATGLLKVVMGTPGSCVTSNAIDGTEATAVTLNVPQSVWADSNDNLYVGEYNAYIVRKVSSTGITTAFVGNKVIGYAGDGGHATSASINDALNFVGSSTEDVFYLGDFAAGVIRKITKPAGSYVINTIAGGASGVSLINNIAATSTALQDVGQIFPAINGSIYFIENVGRIRRLSSVSGSTSYLISTVATTSYLVAGLCLDLSGNLFFSTVMNSDVKMIPALTTTPVTVAGSFGGTGFTGDGGPATLARLMVTTYLQCDNATGDVYVADTFNGRLRILDYTPSIPKFIMSNAAGQTSAAFIADGTVQATAVNLRQPFDTFVTGTLSTFPYQNVVYTYS